MSIANPPCDLLNKITFDKSANSNIILSDKQSCRVKQLWWKLETTTYKRMIIILYLL